MPLFGAAYLAQHMLHQIKAQQFNSDFLHFQGGASFVDLFYSYFVFAILSCLCLAALWSPAGKGLTSWLSCIRHFVVLLLLSHTVWYLIVSIPDLCLLPYFLMLITSSIVSVRPL